MGLVKERVIRSFHGTDFSPVGLWQLNNADGNNPLEDSSGNGRTLSTSGTIDYYRSHVLGTTCGRANTSTSCFVLNDNTLAYTGAVSAFMVVHVASSAAANSFISYYATGETEVTNTLYSLRVQTSRLLNYVHERDAGVDEILTSTYALALRSWCHVGFTRTSGGTVKIYINGMEAASSTLTPPTGGTDSTMRFRISGLGDGTGATGTNISSVVLYNTVISPDRVLYLAKKTLAL